MQYFEEQKLVRTWRGKPALFPRQKMWLPVGDRTLKIQLIKCAVNFSIMDVKSPKKRHITVGTSH
jgi:hypothetical protein